MSSEIEARLGNAIGILILICNGIWYSLGRDIGLNQERKLGRNETIEIKIEKI